MSTRPKEAQSLNDFAALCRKQLSLYELLLECFELKEQAIREARADSLQQIITQETSLLREIRTIDHQRRVQQSMLLRDDDGATSVDLLDHLDADQREVIQPILAQLRSTAQQVKTRSAMLRTAAESLSAHLTGIVRTAWSAIEQNAVYERSGCVTAGGTNLGIDVKS